MLPNKTMATILNKQPVQSSKFDKFWCTQIHLILPSETTTGILIYRLQPYDGRYVLSSNARHLTFTNFSDPNIDPTVHEIVELVISEAERLHGLQNTLHSFKVASHDPRMPTSAFFAYNESSTQIIADCFRYAATDTQFGQNIDRLLSLLAQLAKMPTLN
jgi:hypothetical protein